MHDSNIIGGVNWRGGSRDQLMLAGLHSDHKVFRIVHVARDTYSAVPNRREGPGGTITVPNPFSKNSLNAGGGTNYHTLLRANNCPPPSILYCRLQSTEVLKSKG